ncbi:crossover junction endodeoxyribonuclease RuvC [candidate division KSB3 bacterium]|uniref:Crossover junction endodeoxyribonuclease RuvC n=1 Tax=candidate division KSB3 bacterium TaxID=2044937 RepID=A0A2G6E940_9BACT|nr:MAG: crossover junction endodeoxyribonuclease RuvC [candidate division KSB3 bacterium]PIE29531.1 MAG: crossover junction endodeoxyribonuclease RuvC [candidate division KSB3 bacterium]
MRVCGIDPGSLKSGFGIIDRHEATLIAIAYGVIRTDPKTPLAQRLLTISTRLQELIQTYQPDEFAVEDVFVAKNAKSSLTLGQARGAVLLTAAQAGLNVAEYTPLEVKQSVVGYGRADKSQVQQMVKVLLSLQEIPQPDDAADALAVAICHHHSMKMCTQLKGV